MMIGTFHKLGKKVMGSSLSMGTVFHVIKIFQSWADVMATQHVTTVNAIELFTLKWFNLLCKFYLIK